jgi:alpha-1,2-mannosyltransferase
MSERVRIRAGDPDAPAAGLLLAPAWLFVGLIVFALATVNMVSALVGRRGVGMVDLDVYRWGGLLARRSTNLYRARFSRSFHFTYPPLAAVVFMPLSLAPLRVLEALSVPVGLVAIVLSSWLSLGIAGYARSIGRLGLALAIGGAALCLEPVRATLLFGQVNLILLALVVADLCLPRHSRWGGIGIGLAAGFKLTPAIFIPYLLMTRRRGAAMRAVATAAATVAVGFVILPSESYQFWIGHLFTNSKRVGNVAYVANQSINGVLQRLVSSSSAHDLWLIGAVLVGTVGLLLAVRASRHGEELTGLVLCALTGLLVSPVSWSHHWVWVIPALVLGVDAALRRSPLFWVAVAAGLTLFDGATSQGVIWRAPASRALAHHWTLAQSVLGDLYVEIGLIALAVAAGWVIAGALRPDATIDLRDAGTRPRSEPSTGTGPPAGPSVRPSADHRPG